MHTQEELRSEVANVDSGPQKGIAAFLLATLGVACSTTPSAKSIIDEHRPTKHEIIETNQTTELPILNSPKIESSLKSADAWLSVLHKAELANPGGVSQLDTQSNFALRTRIDEITGQLNTNYSQLTTEQRNTELGRAAQATYNSLVELRGSLGQGSVARIVTQTHQNVHETFELCDVSFTSSLRDCLTTAIASRTDNETQQYFHKLLGLHPSEVETPRYASVPQKTTIVQDASIQNQKVTIPKKIAEAPLPETKEHVAINKEVKWDPFVTKQQAPRSAAEDAATFFGVAGGILAIWKGAQVLWPILFL